MEAFVERALRKILKAASRKERQLRESCQEVLAKLKAISKERATSKSPPDTDADKYFRPFQLACLSKNTRIKATALDCLQKLIAYSYLRGRSKIAGAAGKKDRTLMDVIIETMCSCKDANDDVQLQVIKALLTSVTSNTCQVRRKSLLMAVQTCYHIFLKASVSSHNMVIRTTAKACLTQMLNVVFTRMEQYDLKRRAAALAEKADAAASSESGGAAAAADGAAAAAASKVAEAVESGSVYGAAWTSLKMGALTGLTASPAASLAVTRGAPAAKSAPTLPSQLHNDAYSLFTALCRLSMKTLQDDESLPPSSGPNAGASAGHHSKMLSLELLLSVLENSGPAFRQTSAFIVAIKEHLCQSLLGNCLTSDMKVVKLSLRIFSELTSRFRDHLKSEVEIFLSRIFLQLLQMSNASIEHRMIVLDVFKEISEDRNMVIEIFLNYDCDPESMSVSEGGLLERIVNEMKRTALGTTGAGKTRNAAEIKLRMLALKSLSSTLNSIVYSVDAFLAKDAAARGAKKQKSEAAEDDDDYVHVAHGDAEMSAHSSSGTGMDSPLPAVAALAASAATPTQGSPGLDFKKVLEHRKLMEQAVKLWKAKPKNAVKFLVERGFLENTPTAIAAFITRYCSDLDKTQTGDYLGEGKDFNIKILHIFVDSNDFTKVDFIDALRGFLDQFRLPGEAQKIDRIMEKFAERYCLGNPGVFRNNDAAFVLVYSIIMLNTDLHNSSIKEEKKISIEEYIRNCRGINDGEDFDPDFLRKIYKKIKDDQISLKEDDDLRDAEATKKTGGGLFGKSEARLRRELFLRDREDLKRSTQLALQRGRKEDEPYLTADMANPGEVQPMFEVVWEAIFTVFTSMLKDDELPEEAVQLCIVGLRNGMRVAGYFKMDGPLLKFCETIRDETKLDDPFSSQLQDINVECMRALLASMTADGDMLRGGWELALTAISQLSVLKQIADGDEVVLATDGDAAKRARAANSGFSLFSSGPSQDEVDRQLKTHIRETAGWVLSQVDWRTVEHCFIGSVHLNSEAIQEFVVALCRVSRGELQDKSTKSRAKHASMPGMQNVPRTFSLQKIVEVTDCNMGTRPRMVWSRIWRELGEYFVFAGCHEDDAVAMYAVDSLKQLSMKFLEKKELKGFNFQRTFLRPFETMMKLSKSSLIRELIIMIINQMVVARSANIESGWQVIFDVLAATVKDAVLVKEAFVIVKRLITDDFALVSGQFAHIVHCLCKFASSPINAVSLEALELLSVCAQKIVDGEVPMSEVSFTSGLALSPSSSVASGMDTMTSAKETSHASSTDELIRFTDSTAHTGVWWPVLTGLAKLVLEQRLEVRMQALQSLFGTLKKCGLGFSRPLWELIFKGVLFPIFDDVSHLDAPQADTGADGAPPALPERKGRRGKSGKKSGGGGGSSSGGGKKGGRARSETGTWLSTTCLAALGTLVDLFAQFFETLSFLLPDVLALLERCIDQDVEDLASIGVTCLQQLVVLAGDTFTDDVWGIFVAQFSKLVELTMPCALFTARRCMLADSPATQVSIAERPSPYRQRSGIKPGETLFTPFGIGELGRRIEASGAANGSDAKAPSAVTVVALRSGARAYLQSEGMMRRVFTAKEREHIATNAKGAAAPVARRRGSTAAAASLPFDRTAVFTSCRIQLELLDALAVWVDKYFERLSVTQLDALMCTVETSFMYAAVFNADLELRGALSAAGYKAGGNGKLPDLLRQETRAVSESLKLIFRLYAHADSAKRSLAEARLTRLVPAVMMTYVEIDKQALRKEGGIHDHSDAGRVVKALTAIIKQILIGLQALEETQFIDHINWLYPMLVDLVGCESRELRCLLGELLRTRIAPMLTR